MLPNKIHDAPPAVPLLDVPHGQRRHLGAPQSAAEKHGDDRSVPEAFGGRHVRGVEQRLRLPEREPVPQADALGRLSRA